MCLYVDVHGLFVWTCGNLNRGFGNLEFFNYTCEAWGLKPAGLECKELKPFKLGICVTSIPGEYIQRFQYLIRLIFGSVVHLTDDAGPSIKVKGGVKNGNYLQ